MTREKQTHRTSLYEIDYVARVPSGKVASLYDMKGKMVGVTHESQLVLRKCCIADSSLAAALAEVVAMDVQFVKLFAYNVVAKGTVVHISETNFSV